MALIVCPNCGKEVSDTVTNCIHCGCEITVCPECGKPSAGKLETCPNCGYKSESGNPSSQGVLETSSSFDWTELQEQWKKNNPKEVRLQKIFTIYRIASFVTFVVILLIWYFTIMNQWVAAGKGNLNAEETLILFVQQQKHLDITKWIFVAVAIQSCIDIPLEYLDQNWVLLRCSAWIRRDKVDMSPYHPNEPFMLTYVAEEYSRNRGKVTARIILIILQSIFASISFIMLTIYSYHIATAKIQSVFVGSDFTLPILPEYIVILIASIVLEIIVSIIKAFRT